MKKILPSIFLIILLLSSTVSCRWFTDAGLPTYMGLKVRTPAGTPTFQRGFRHGCGNATYARGNVLYRNTNKYQYDPKLIGNPEYRFGVQRGYTACFDYVNNPQTGPRSSSDAFLLPNGADPMGYYPDKARNWNDAAGGMFDGLSAATVMGGGGGMDNIYSAFTKSAIGGQSIFGTINSTGSGPSESNILWSGTSGVCVFGWWC